PLSHAGGARPVAMVATLELPGIDAQALRERNATLSKGAYPLRFAESIEVLATPDTDGTWEDLPDGGRLWRLRVFVPGATDLNFGFESCWLPEGATLHFVAENEDYYQGPYTSLDNQPHGQL